MNKAIQQYVYNFDTNKYPLSLYKFAYKGPLSYSLFYSGGKLKNYGVVHCDDLIHLLQSPALFADSLSKYYGKNTMQAQIIKDMVDFYIYFAKNG
jgi:juvenile-hormone esterase